MNRIKRLLWKLNWAKYPTTLKTRYAELVEDYKAAVKLVADLTIKIEKYHNTEVPVPASKDKSARKRRTTNKKK